MHSNGKGMADSALPYKRTPPAWLKISAAEVEDQGEYRNGNTCSTGSRYSLPINVILIPFNGLVYSSSNVPYESSGLFEKVKKIPWVKGYLPRPTEPKLGSFSCSENELIFYQYYVYSVKNVDEYRSL